MKESARRQLLICLVGPTAVGKTALSCKLARAFGGEVISCDSRQIYRGMDVGTAKPTAEEKGNVPHHMIDVADPREDYSAARYAAEATQAVERVLARGRLPIVTGGTGLYLRALVTGMYGDAGGGDAPGSGGAARIYWQAYLEMYGEERLLEALRAVDGETAGRLHQRDHVRVVRALEVFTETGVTMAEHLRRSARRPRRFETLTIGLRRDRTRLYERIDARVDEMMSQGFLEEVRRLRDAGVPEDVPAMNAIGYRELGEVLDGQATLTEAVARIKQATRRYAKRQITWFAHQWDAEWLDAGAGNLLTASTEIVEKSILS
ncbi:MAG: tRNA (adenosine(37)-N6)-dimethylallyltransferase MiaA [Oscillospiraceae bacterium]|jgi:tRNA dimethylallyltransferase|nr:tRNA (adenosine(37)-N6)-dimethylallyltransferase MiaA [Oscillospiraceae bacterium]